VALISFGAVTATTKLGRLSLVYQKNKVWDESRNEVSRLALSVGTFAAEKVMVHPL
jgi:hypothetical protein